MGVPGEKRLPAPPKRAATAIAVTRLRCRSPFADRAHLPTSGPLRIGGLTFCGAHTRTTPAPQALSPVDKRTNSAVRIGLGSFAALLSAQWGLSLSQVPIPLVCRSSPLRLRAHDPPHPGGPASRPSSPLPPQAGGFVPLLLQAFGLGHPQPPLSDPDDPDSPFGPAQHAPGPLPLTLPGPQRPVVTEFAAGIYHLLMGWWEAADAHRAGVSRAEARAPASPNRPASRPLHRPTPQRR